MIQLILEIDPADVDAVTEWVKSNPFIKSWAVEDPDDQNVQAMSSQIFYKLINAANLAIQEQRVYNQADLEREVKQW